MSERPIVVGHDGSDRGDDAVALAGVLAELTDAPIEVVSVYPYASLPSRLGGFVFTPVTRLEAEAAVERGRAALADRPGVSTRARPAGTATLGLELAAAQADALIVVVGSTHRGRLGRVLPGSTGRQLLGYGAWPVAVAPLGYAARARAPAVIGVAYDGSEQSGVALRWAARLAEGGGAVRLIGAFDSTMRLNAVSAPLYGMPSYVEEARRDAQHALEQAAATVPGGAAVELLDGPPEECLREASERVDLLLLGSGRRGRLSRVLLGGVSSGLVDHAASAVLILGDAASDQALSSGPAGPVTSASSEGGVPRSAR